MASGQHCTSSRSSEAIILSSQRPVQQRKMSKKRRKTSTKVKRTNAFYKSNPWRHNSSIHHTAKFVDVEYSPVISDDDRHIVPDSIEPPSKKKRMSRGETCPNSSIHLTDKCVDVTFIVSEDDSDIVALSDVTIIVSDDESDIDIIVHGRDTPYSPPASDENTESDDSTADLFAQMYETYPDSE